MLLEDGGGWEKSKDPLSPLGNTSAFQEIHSYQNTFFNNTAYNFVIGSQRQAPHAGRNKFLSNIWDAIGDRVFRHSNPAKLMADANAKEGVDLTGITISNNHFLDKNSTGVGKNETSSPVDFIDSAKNDYRLKPNSPAYHSGQKLQTVPADINGKTWSKQGPDRGAFAAE